MTYMCRVHPNLMRAPRFKPALEHCGMASECFNDTKTGYCMSAALKKHRLPLPIRLVPRKHGRDLYDCARFEADPGYPFQSRISGVRHTVAQCEVATFDGVLGELLGKPVVGCVGFGDDQKSAGVLVYAVNNPRSFFASDARQIAAEVVQQGIDKRSAWRSWGGMNHHSRRFVDDEEVLILVHDLKRDILGGGVHIGCLFDCNLENVAFGHLAFRIGDDLSVLRYGAFHEKPGQTRST